MGTDVSSMPMSAGSMPLFGICLNLKLDSLCIYVVSAGMGVGEKVGPMDDLVLSVASFG